MRPPGCERKPHFFSNLSLCRYLFYSRVGLRKKLRKVYESKLMNRCDENTPNRNGVFRYVMTDDANISESTFIFLIRKMSFYITVVPFCFRHLASLSLLCIWLSLIYSLHSHFLLFVPDPITRNTRRDSAVISSSDRLTRVSVAIGNIMYGQFSIPASLHRWLKYAVSVW